MDNKLDAQWLIEVRERMASHDVHAPADGWQRLSAQLPVARHTDGNRWLLRVAAILIPVLVGVFLWHGMEYQYPNQYQNTAHYPTPIIQCPTLDSSSQGARGTVHHLSPDSLSPAVNGLSPSLISPRFPEDRNPTRDEAQPQHPTPDSPTQGAEENLVEGSRIPPHRGLGGALLTSLGALPISNSRGMHPGGTSGNPSANEMSENITSSNHYLWSIGIMASKQLSNLFAIESGITYTQMGATIHIFNKAYDQTVRYIGIPLHLRADIYDMPAWNVYATAGTTLDFCIDAKRGNQPLSMPLTQWSADGYVGIQYMLNSHWGIYVQPGVRYYINPDEKSHTLISEHPLQFDLQIGTRISY